MLELGTSLNLLIVKFSAWAMMIILSDCSSESFPGRLVNGRGRKKISPKMHSVEQGWVLGGETSFER